jgi:GT2 family glycosyltransferase
LEIIVVDNNSQDGSRELVKNQFPRVKLIQSRENLGFGKANNLGIFESSAEFILLLNVDATLNADALDVLLLEMKKNSRIGGLGPALQSGPASYQVSFGNRVDFFSELVQKGFYNLYYKNRLKAELRKREVGWLSAACLLIRKKALEEAGCFDENFFLYFEDIDLCYRIRSRGWKLLLLPQARVTHIGGTSTSAAKGFSRYQYRKSQLYFYRKHNSRASYNLLRVYLWLNFSLLFFSLQRKKTGDSVGKKDFFCLLKS